MFNVPDDVKLSATLTSGGTPTDPTALVLIVKKPDGTRISYASSTGWSDQGTWDASDNDPELVDGTGTAGYYYTNTKAGSVDFGNGTIIFAVGDRVFYNGATWRCMPNPSTTTLTKAGTGDFYVYQTVSQAGDWKVSGEAVGNRAADNLTVGVRPSAVG